MLYIGELLHCTTPGLHLASHRGLRDSLSQRTGMRPNGRKPAWLQDPSSHNSPQQEGFSSIQECDTWGTLAWCFLCSTSQVAVPAMTLASRSDTGVRGNVTFISKTAVIPLVQLFLLLLCKLGVVSSLLLSIVCTSS